MARRQAHILWAVDADLVKHNNVLMHHLHCDNTFCRTATACMFDWQAKHLLCASTERLLSCPGDLPTHLALSAAATTLTTRAIGDSVGATCLQRSVSRADPHITWRSWNSKIWIEHI